MKKFLLTAVAAVALATPALAADMKVKAPAAPEAPPSPWDVAFGGGLTSDYIFRGITQSNHRPSVTAYFEPRYNVTKDLQYYVGISGESISFPNRAAAEIDIYGGFRPTFGPLALDFGVWYYWYPGGQCFNGSTAPVFGLDCLANGYLPINGNVIKRDLSFVEGYAKGTFTVNDQVAYNGSVWYSPSVLNSGAPGTYVTLGAKFTAPTSAMPEGWGFYLSGEAGHWFLGTSDNFYCTQVAATGAPRRIRTAFPTTATPPGMSVSASPRACSRSTCGTTTRTTARLTATPSRATTRHGSRGTSAGSIRLGSAPAGAAPLSSRPASST